MTAVSLSSMVGDIASQTPSIATEFDASSQTTDTALSQTTSNTTIHSLTADFEQSGANFSSKRRPAGTSNISHDATPPHGHLDTPSSSGRPSRRAKPTLKAQALAAGSGRLSKLFNKNTTGLKPSDALSANLAEVQHLQDPHTDGQTHSTKEDNTSQVVAPREQAGSHYSSSLSPAPSSQSGLDRLVELDQSGSPMQEVSAASHAENSEAIPQQHSISTSSCSSSKRKRTRTIQDDIRASEKQTSAVQSRRGTSPAASPDVTSIGHTQIIQSRGNAIEQSSINYRGLPSTDGRDYITDSSRSSLQPSHRSSRRSGMKQQEVGVPRAISAQRQIHPQKGLFTGRTAQGLQPDSASSTNLRMRTPAEKTIAAIRTEKDSGGPSGQHHTSSRESQKLVVISEAAHSGTAAKQQAVGCDLSCLNEGQLLYAFAAVCEIDDENPTEEDLRKRLGVFCVCRERSPNVKPGPKIKLNVGQRSRLSQQVTR